MGNLSNYVTVTISRNSVGVTRAGFGTMLILSYTAAWAERTRTYSDLAAVGADFAIDTPEYLAAAAAFAQDPAPPQVKIARGALKPTLRYNFSGLVAAPSTTYQLVASGTGVTTTTVTYQTPAADIAFTGANAGDLFTAAAHGHSTGDGPFRLSGGSLPTGVAIDTNYWFIKISADTFQLATTHANALALTAIVLSGDGTGTLLETTNDVIVAQLVDKLNAVTGKNFTAAQVPGAGETDSFTVTANAAGAWFSLHLVELRAMTLEINHADPGVATDLAAIKLADGDWYALETNFNSTAYVLAAAAWVESSKKIYIPDTASNADILTATTGSSGIGDQLKTLDYARTHPEYASNPALMRAARLYGKVLPDDPGSETWADKNLAGDAAEPLDDTMRANLVARNMNSYEDVAGIGITFDGRVSSGEFLDTTRFLDWFEDDAAKAIFGAKVNSKKIPQTDPGIAKIETELRGSILRGIDRGGFDPAYTIVVPLAKDISSADRATRTLNGIKFSAKLTGAVHRVNVQGNVVS